ncbi:hypothetical protein DFH27DRAFT_317041 [Peziza echinospora]|nr:hypothetical protein DFH27DRAFT_317041 [Peziza echinospora]
MIIDGVKWACDACIRGHRVSGCTHSDRELKQIAKKGRPVSQCPHCRHLRKSRSAHVKCDCGERHGKDAKKAGNAACCASEKGEKKVAAGQCTCCHGGRCTCAVKKDAPPALRTVPELQAELQRSGAAPAEARRPRIQSTQSEGSLTTFANGHHRPTHRSHHAHGISPYTISGHADHSRHSFLDDGDAGSPPMAKRRVKSDASPSDLLAISRLHNSGLLALEMELTPRQATPRQASHRLQHGLSVDTNQSQFSLHESYSQDYLQSADADPHQFSAGLTPSVGWPMHSSYDIDWLYPGLTSCSSGDETDEQFNNASRSLTSTGPLPSEASDLGDDSYRMSTANSFIGVQTPGILSNDHSPYDMDRYPLDYSPLDSSSKHFNIERYLAETTPQRTAFLTLPMSGDAGYDADSHLFASAYLSSHQQEISDSSDALDLLASNIHSPTDSSGMLLGMSTPMSAAEDEGLVWMRKYSNASTYHSAMDAGWHNTSQCQSPR